MSICSYDKYDKLFDVDQNHMYEHTHIIHYSSYLDMKSRYCLWLGRSVAPKGCQYVLMINCWIQINHTYEHIHTIRFSIYWAHPNNLWFVHVLILFKTNLHSFTACQNKGMFGLLMSY